MRERTAAATLLTMAASGLALAGCTDDSATTSPSVSAGAPTASGGASANLSGGGGVSVAIGHNGETVIDFSKMQPVDFTTKVAGAEVTGKFTFSGQVAATVRIGNGSAGPAPSTGPTMSAGASTGPAASSSPGGGTGRGTWEPMPPINWGDTRVTVDLTAPMKIRPVDNVRIADYVGDGASRTGNVVDIEPLLGKGTYQCRGDSQILTPDEGGTGWTLTRA